MLQKYLFKKMTKQTETTKTVTNYTNKKLIKAKIKLKLIKMTKAHTKMTKTEIKNKCCTEFLLQSKN